MAGGDTAKAIVEAARSRFERYGYKKTTVDEIARDAGIAKGTFYLHFRSKDELFIKVLMVIRQEILAEFTEVLEGQATATDKLRATLRFMFDALERHPIFARITAQDKEFMLALRSAPDPDLAGKIDERVEFFQRLFEEGIRSGEIREDIDTRAMIMVLGSLKLLFFYKHLVPERFATEEQFIDGIVDMAMYGIVKRQ